MSGYPKKKCCCGGPSTCDKCFGGAAWQLKLLISGLTGAAAPWNNLYTLNFNSECVTAGFTIAQACGSTLAGINATFTGTELCATIADLFGVHYRWCGQVDCEMLKAGVLSLPNTVEGCGGPGTVVATGTLM